MLYFKPNKELSCLKPPDTPSQNSLAMLENQSMDLSQAFKIVIDQVAGQLPLQVVTLNDFKSDQETFFRNLLLQILDSLPGLTVQVRERLIAEFLGFGPLEQLLADKELTEILVNDYQTLWIERNGRLASHDSSFLSPITYNLVVQRICLEAKVHFNLQFPFCDGKFRQFRLHLMAPPLDSRSVSLSLRQHPENPWTLEKLRREDFMTDSQLDRLRQILVRRESFLVVGGTGTGKTSLLNSALRELEPSERVVMIEDNQELCLPNPASVSLHTRNDPSRELRDYTQSDLLRQSLRMRPDRIVIGEVRGAEACDLLMALSTGHAGSFSSLHAGGARQALWRLEMLIQMGAPQWHLEAIRRLIYLTLQWVITIDRDSSGHRHIEGFYRLTGLEDHGFLIEQIKDDYFDSALPSAR